jgi:hypothetical protein
MSAKRGHWFRNRLAGSTSRARDARHLCRCDAEGMRDLLGDAYTAEPGVVALQLNDRRDEFCRWTFGAGFAATVAGGKEQTIFVIDQCLVELEQRAGLMSAPSFGIRPGLTNSVVSAIRKRSSVVRFGALRLDRLPIRSCCFSNRDSAATARTPPGRTSLQTVTSRWMARMSSSRTERTVPSPPARARLQRTGGFPHTMISPPTGEHSPNTLRTSTLNKSDHALIMPQPRAR